MPSTVTIAAGQASATFAVTIQLIFQPGIDIKPGDSTNTINLKRDASIAVAILSTANFNATTQVNAASLRFGETGTEASLQLDKKGHPKVSFQDVNGDGRLDLVVTFVTSKTGLLVGDTQAILTGNLVSGVAFESFGPVNIVNQNGKFAPKSAAQASGPTSASTVPAPATANEPSDPLVTALPLFVDTSDPQRRKS